MGDPEWAGSSYLTDRFYDTEDETLVDLNATNFNNLVYQSDDHWVVYLYETCYKCKATIYQIVERIKTYVEGIAKIGRFNC